MMGRTPTTAEKVYMDTVAQVGCIVCIVFHERPEQFGDGYCEIHHTAGSQVEGCHLKTIGLCEKHHRHADKNSDEPRWISRHGNGRRAFEERYAPEADLLQIQQRLNAQHTELRAIT